MSEEQAAEAVAEPVDVSDEPVIEVDEAKAAVDRAFEAVSSADLKEAIEQPDLVENQEATKKFTKDLESDLKESRSKDETKPAEPKVDAKGREHNPDGTFKAKEKDDGEEPENTAKEEPADSSITTFAEPPNRFSADAKSAWKNAPEPIRAEIHRAVKELESGIEKYREEIAEFEPLREYNQMAKQHGTNIKDALDRYTGLERMLAGENPMAAIQDVMSYAGVSPQQFAAQVLKENGIEGEVTPEHLAQLQNAGHQDSVIRSLRNEIAALKQEISGVSTSVQDQKTAEIERQVTAFAADKPRFEELSEDIKFFIESGRTDDLAEAYDLAERLNPAPVASEPPPVEEPAPDAQPKKGSLSVTGAPSSGSNPANRKPPSSAKDAVDRSFETLGIG